MNEQHTKSLYENHPIMYGGRKRPLNQSLMAFGFMCGDGWYYPISRFSDIVEALNVLASPFGVWVEMVEVKEKFGTCRLYHNTNYRLPFWKRLCNWCLTPIVKLTKNYNIGFGPSDMQMSLMAGLNEIVEQLAVKCEDECTNYCENCGLQFGSWNREKRVMTLGWISIICKDCAEKAKQLYDPYPLGGNEPLWQEETTESTPREDKE